MTFLSPTSLDCFSCLISSIILLMSKHPIISSSLLFISQNYSKYPYTIGRYEAIEITSEFDEVFRNRFLWGESAITYHHRGHYFCHTLMQNHFFAGFEYLGESRRYTLLCTRQKE